MPSRGEPPIRTMKARSTTTKTPSESFRFSSYSAALAAERQRQLTKPPGSLGRLEDVVVWLAQWQGRSMPRLDRVDILVFAGNHGVTAQGVSPYPPSVTAQMVASQAKIAAPLIKTRS